MVVGLRRGCPRPPRSSAMAPARACQPRVASCLARSTTQNTCLATVDAVLSSPPVDRLLADPEVSGDVDDRSTRINKVENPTAERRWIAPASPQLHLLEAACPFSISNTSKPWADQDVNQTRGRPWRAGADVGHHPRPCAQREQGETHVARGLGISINELSGLLVVAQSFEYTRTAKRG